MFNIFTSAEAAITEKLIVFALQPLSIITLGLSSIAVSILMVWMGYRAYMVMAGFASEPLLEILRDLLIKIFFLTIATSVAFYVDYVFTPLTQTSEQLGIELGGKNSDSIFGVLEGHFIEVGIVLDTFATGEEPPQSAVDQATAANGGEPIGFIRWAWNSIKDTTAEVVDEVAGIFDIDNVWMKLMMFLMVMIMSIGLTIFGIAAFISMITNKLFFMISLGFGPIFIFMAAFNNTRSYFFSWLSTTLGYALSYALIMSVISISMTLFKELFVSNGLDYLIAISNFIICLIFTIIILRIGDLSSAFFGAGNMSDGAIAAISRSYSMVAKKALGGMRASSDKSKNPSKSSIKKDKK